jgi:ATP-dependent Clp endopeptidase proteolytic subunit ClpP
MPKPKTKTPPTTAEPSPAAPDDDPTTVEYLPEGGRTVTEVELVEAKLRLEIQGLGQQVEVNQIALKRARSSADVARILTFYGEVSPGMVLDAMTELGRWARRDPAEPIRLIFNSPGGTLWDGLALFDYILELRSLGHVVETVALGRAASMGGILLQAGTTRIMGANAWMLLHEVSSATFGTTAEMTDDLAFTSRLQDRCVELLAHRSNLTARQIKAKWKKKDWWLSASEALELGFVDVVRQVP